MRLNQLLLASLFPFLVLISCGGEPQLFAITAFDFGRLSEADDTIAPGFDLDGRVSERGDDESCGAADFKSPAPDAEEGVDNQLGALMSLAPASLSTDIANAIASGELLLLIQVGGLDDPQQDDQVTVEMMEGLVPGSVAPVLADGKLAGGQTFDVSASSLSGERARANASGRVSGGRLDASGFDLDFELSVGGQKAPIHLQLGQVRFDVSAGGLANGVVGGSLSIDDAVSAGLLLGFEEGVVRPAIEGQADLNRDPSGECTRISGSFVFSGVTAVRGDDRP